MNEMNTTDFSMCDCCEGAAVVSPDTHFAPAGRVDNERLARQRTTLEKTLFLQSTLDSFPALVLVLNANRQVVGANQGVLDLLGVKLTDLLGRRPGEVMGCVRPPEGPDGCGTAPGCITCGAVNAILESQRATDKVSRECHLILQGPPPGQAMDLRVTASTMRIEAELFTLCTIEDVSDEKRLRVLSRTFFHDVLNTAGGIYGFAQLMADSRSKSDTRPGLPAKLVRMTNQLIEEIRVQRDLMSAESGDLTVQWNEVSAATLLDDLAALYGSHSTAESRRIVVEKGYNGSFVTDVRLVNRVLGNLARNALEATPAGGTVTIRCEEDKDAVVFRVHNESVMSDEVRFQIFQRSFSTKSEAGHGVGTYSVRLLTERYLGGEVAFTSLPGEGTTFSVRLPKSPASLTNAG